MPARSLEAAVDDLLVRLRAIVGCVTNRPFVGFRQGSMAQTRSISFAPPEDPVIVRSHDRRTLLLLTARLDCVVIAAGTSTNEFTTAEIGYSYRIADRDDREILAWHWHPLGRSDITHPHVHLSSAIAPITLGRGLDPLPLADLHLPSGQVALADVVRFLIAEVGVRPRKRDWRATIDAS